jgi:hypothetical protein
LDPPQVPSGLVFADDEGAGLLETVEAGLADEVGLADDAVTPLQDPKAD